MPARRHNSRIVIRKVRTTDALPFLKLEAECFGMCFSKDIFYYWRPIVDYCYAFKATLKSEIIGGVIAIPTRNNELYINSLFVAQRFRRRNIGNRLMREILSFKQFGQLVLDVKVDKKFVIAFYRKLGFRESALMNNYYLDGTDRILMRLSRVL